MWRCTSKLAIATFLKNLQSNTVFTTVVSHNLNCILRFKPEIVVHFDRYYGFYKKTCGKFSKGNKQEQTNKKKPSFLENFDQNFFDVLRWGAVCVLGYGFVTQNKSTYFEPHDRQCTSTLSKYQKTLQYLTGSINVQSFNYVLPEVQAAKSRKSYTNVAEEQHTENSNFEDENFSSLEKAHKKVSGALNNWLGVQYVESGDYEKALRFFNKATTEENPAGIFNLGICHEKGFGTSQNFEKAAELYQKAANLGHASAMYNLGVFYVQGLGGIRPDKNHARELFREAAKLGQAEAITALSLDQEILEDSPIKDLSHTQKSENNITQLISDTFLSSKSKKTVKNYEYDEKKKNDTDELLYYLGEKSLGSSLNSDSGVLDLSPPNDSEVS